MTNYWKRAESEVHTTKLSKSTNMESERKGNIQRGNAWSLVGTRIVLGSWDPNKQVTWPWPCTLCSFSSALAVYFTLGSTPIAVTSSGANLTPTVRVIQCLTHSWFTLCPCFYSRGLPLQMLILSQSLQVTWHLAPLSGRPSSHQGYPHLRELPSCIFNTVEQPSSATQSWVFLGGVSWV